jgi:glutathione peroxidase
MLKTALTLSLSLSLLAAAATSSAQPTGVINPHPLAAAAPAPASCPVLLKQSFKRLQDEAPQDLCQYAGKVVLVVNTASYCGYTKQYEGLEKLYAKYSPRGLVVLGFPSNDFKQEAASTKEIADLCYNTYGVKFPMFAPTGVSGANANPLHAALAKQTGKEPKWNFTKYLIGRDGKVLAHYPSKVTPDDPDLLKQIEGAL